MELKNGLSWLKRSRCVPAHWALLLRIAGKAGHRRSCKRALVLAGSLGQKLPSQVSAAGLLLSRSSCGANDLHA